MRALAQLGRTVWRTSGARLFGSLETLSSAPVAPWGLPSARRTAHWVPLDVLHWGEASRHVCTAAGSVGRLRPLERPGYGGGRWRVLGNGVRPICTVELDL